MYIPKHFEEKDLHQVKHLIKEFGFATLVSIKDGLPWATHLPLELEEKSNEEWFLYGHISKANPQWRNFEGENEILAIFMGPHTYVSPSWYSKPNVPTWNYKAVHVYGKAVILEGEDLKNMLRQIMKRYEDAHAALPLTFDELPGEVIEKDLRGLVGFKIKVERIDAASKLSQNRDVMSYENIIEHLKTLGQYDSARVAEEMEKRKKKL